MLSFVERLRASQRAQDSLLCIGLDPALDRVMAAVGNEKDPAPAVLAFNKAIIEATSDLVCAYKPNLAFYEALGAEGWHVLAETIRLVPEPVLVIGDAKRGDVGHTSVAYAQALFDICGFDAVTVSPYLGRDSLQPFLSRPDRGAFILCRTSNPGARDFQDLIVLEENSRPRPLYQVVAERVAKWNEAGNCGLVVGATYPAEILSVRQLAPDLPLLIPGVGAQAGDLAAAVQAGVNAAGELAVINSSRQIIYASSGADFALAARRAASDLRDRINAIRRAR